MGATLDGQPAPYACEIALSAAYQKILAGSVCDQKPGADIADGYHRVSLAYNIDPFMSVPLRLG
jgi:hypothetical protein